jgi:hypothetical protein
MLAGALNKGFRGAMPALISIFVLGAIFSFFALKPVESNSYPDLFYNYFAQKIESRFFVVCLNYFFIALGVLLISLISVNQEIVEKQNYFPVFIYMMLCVSCAQPNQIMPQLLTNVLLLFCVYRLLDTYRKEEVLSQVYEAAFWLSAAAFVTISAIIYFPLFFVILLILRPFNWREWVVAFLGFVSPVFLYECVAYLSDFNQWYFINAVENFFDYLKFPSFSEYFLPLIFFLLLFIFISVIRGFITGFGNTVKKQRSKSILLWCIFLASLGCFSGGANSSTIILIQAFPISFFIGDFLFDLKQTKITNTILFAFLLCSLLVFLAQYKLI